MFSFALEQLSLCQVVGGSVAVDDRYFLFTLCHLMLVILLLYFLLDFSNACDFVLLLVSISVFDTCVWNNVFTERINEIFYQ